MFSNFNSNTRRSPSRKIKKKNVHFKRVEIEITRGDGSNMIVRILMGKFEPKKYLIMTAVPMKIEEILHINNNTLFGGKITAKVIGVTPTVKFNPIMTEQQYSNQAQLELQLDDTEMKRAEDLHYRVLSY